jgi:hypothetical protein
MKLFISAALLLFSFGYTIVQAQEKPITQAEYVQMLYDLDRNPKTHDEVVETIRRRGIGFEITSGIRTLTATKSKNDAELKRTLEEAGRRKADPKSFVLPGEKEASEALKKSREATLAAVDEMPDFVVKQQIQRSWAFAGTNNFKSLDRLIVAVSYRAAGNEEYKVMSINGVVQSEPKIKNTYEEVGGTSSTGEFVTVLATIFKPESETKFATVDTDVLRGRRAIVYSFETAKDKAKEEITHAGTFNDSTIAGMKGKIWIDRESFRVLRVESAATEIPDTFPVRAASRNIDYDWVTISGEKYLLPSLSEVRLTSREDNLSARGSRDLVETRNLIRFKEYQKYGSEVKILDDDVDPKDDKPKP